MKTIVGLCGFKGAGKTYTAKLLREYLLSRDIPVQVLSFASPLKRMCETIHPGITTMPKDIYNERLKGTPRDIYIKTGTAFRNVYGDDIFVKMLSDDVNRAFKSGCVVIIDDVRFKIEMDYIRSKNGGIYKIIDPDSIADPSEPTETEHLQGPFDAVICNSHDNNIWYIDDLIQIIVYENSLRTPWGLPQ